MSRDATASAIPQAPPVLGGERVHRIHWVLGTDLLHAVCHCGADRFFDDPVELWEWLLGHPDDHRPPPGANTDAGPAPASDREPASTPA
ncbi:hypothetical protein AD006_30675 (plasmid) [Pseudonocardia sp. EC080610-09]|uniref:hypothetical protein n=1 Tax=unclassified Pseudonocardia TaxID=2619320 RepID=UPI000706D52F|nr:MULTISPECIES: hypothetical protein [unclassified Pseudonocardia]ALL79572.1 hypothetical protein AD006_30675 [Pseudonocardia sp. EC080610-09]ALL85474.1 hypothetical protein AD017_30565 [Pseudonocardia sp. EC080619-01]